MKVYVVTGYGVDSVWFDEESAKRRASEIDQTHNEGVSEVVKIETERELDYWDTLEDPFTEDN